MTVSVAQQECIRYIFVHFSNTIGLNYIISDTVSFRTTRISKSEQWTETSVHKLFTDLHSRPSTCGVACMLVKTATAPEKSGPPVPTQYKYLLYLTFDLTRATFINWDVGRLSCIRCDPYLFFVAIMKS